MSSLHDEDRREYTPREKFANWLHYNKWWVFAVIFLAVVLSSMVMTRSKDKATRSDYCIGYVATRELSQECLDKLKQGIAALGTDVDGDGTVTVKVNQYIPGSNTAVTENASHGRTAEVALLTDISEMESYIFLVEYPEDFQLDFQLLAHMDGSPSADDDFGVWDKVIPWSDCAALAEMELGTMTDEQGNPADAQDWMARLYVGRRCFLQEKAEADSPENKALWETITQGASPVQ